MNLENGSNWDNKLDKSLDNELDNFQSIEDIESEMEKIEYAWDRLDELEERFLAEKKKYEMQIEKYRKSLRYTERDKEILVSDLYMKIDELEKQYYENCELPRDVLRKRYEKYIYIIVKIKVAYEEDVESVRNMNSESGTVDMESHLDELKKRTGECEGIIKKRAMELQERVEFAQQAQRMMQVEKLSKGR